MRIWSDFRQTTTKINNTVTLIMIFTTIAITIHSIIQIKLRTKSKFSREQLES